MSKDVFERPAAIGFEWSAGPKGFHHSTSENSYLHQHQWRKSSKSPSRLGEKNMTYF